MTTYLLMGLWTWVSITVVRYDVFKAAPMKDNVLSLIYTVLLWPVMFAFSLWYHNRRQTDE